MTYFTFIRGKLAEIDEEKGLMRWLISERAPQTKMHTIYEVYDVLEEQMERVKWIPWRRSEHDLGAVINLTN